MKICKVCGFKTDNGKIMSNHIRWAHKEHFTKEGLEKLRSKKVERITKKFICAKCSKEFELTLTLNDLNKKNKWFCSRSCSNSRILLKETKEKIRSKLIKVKQKKNCPICGKEFFTKNKTCSLSCGNFLRYKNVNKFSKKYYSSLCAFSFNLSDFPNEFDFNLIEKYGWYKAKNHGNNLNGISRDHMLSVSYGFKNNIDPKIMSHPANCKLMRHSENISKYSKSSISYEELLIRIEEWNKKYGVVV